MRTSGRQSYLRTHLYRKFHDYGWERLGIDAGAVLDAVPSALQTNAAPAGGKGVFAASASVVANIRAASRFTHLSTDDAGAGDDAVLRLARSAWLETRLPTGDAARPPSAIHVLNFVLFPSPHLRDGDEYLGLPIFGADLVSLPGNKHLAALDFQPTLPVDDRDGRLLPRRYASLERKLEAIHAKYQHADGDPCAKAPLPWGGDVPLAALRFFSPYALWTRLGDDHAAATVDTAVWQAFQEYINLYLELMRAVQQDARTGALETGAGDDHAALHGQRDYLAYRRDNDPARPMLRRLYGGAWAERAIGEVLFPDV